jgi:hypothetical protein
LYYSKQERKTFIDTARTEEIYDVAPLHPRKDSDPDPDGCIKKCDELQAIVK